MSKLKILTMNTSNSDWCVNCNCEIREVHAVCVLEGGSGFLSWRGPYGILELAVNERAAQLYTHCVSWTSIHKSIVFPLHSSFFLKVHSHSGDTPSHPAEWGRAEYMRLHLGDLLALALREHGSLTPRWLIQLCWNLVSRMKSVLYHFDIVIQWIKQVPS